MTVEEAAELLYQQIGAPAGAINTLAWYEGRKPCIRVWINPDYRRPIPRHIKTFHGFNVIYEVRGPFEAQCMTAPQRAVISGAA